MITEPKPLNKKQVKEVERKIKDWKKLDYWKSPRMTALTIARYLKTKKPDLKITLWEREVRRDRKIGRLRSIGAREYKGYSIRINGEEIHDTTETYRTNGELLGKVLKIIKEG